MNKDVLLKYAQFARNELETQIGLSLKKLGITENGILDIKKLGDVYVIDGSHNSITVQEFKARESIINNYINNSSFQNVVEEFSYTWFNRIIAIRFMEVHEYFPHGFRVLTSRDGSYEPEILQNVDYIINDLGLSEDTVNNYKSNSKLEELYKYILVNQCKKLSCVIPMLFNDDGKYLEYLLPSNLLSQDSIIRKITDIPEEDFLNDVEVVGWLYQDYVSANREFYRKAKKVTKELIPTLSQVFTPDWIVRYMAENSVGRIWIESYPNSSLKSKMKYYIDDAKQEKEVQEKINEIKYKNVNPKDIKIIEPCCGSGHILVYVFDLLFEMYLELGYEKKSIPSLILEYNLFGLDVDKRAAQLAEFSLLMKARSIDNKFFNEDRFKRPNVYEILDSQSVINYKDNIKGLNFSTKFLDIADYLVNTFKDGKIIGSLLKIKNLNYEDFINEFETVKNNSSLLPAERLILDNLNILIKLAKIADILSKKYDVMITNPPYLGISKIDKNAKEYLIKNYPNSKSDMFAMFMEAGLVSQNGFRAIINPDSWMFLASYYELRSKILSKESIITLA
ncbi:MAG: BREX-1 system adenine-specific DNA-methyltransferase PglX, partial [Bdellovibrionota bacterium]|nr:BREX-1 system adenine-specific DNA-methyltransferase PglX [Bdellovibrionota bacterium]